MSTGKSPQGIHSHTSLARSASVIAAATLCSRILGFIRDMVIARLFGVYVYAQAFVIAFKIPNLFRDLVGEGATNAAFVPVFSEYHARRPKEEFWELANVILNLLLVIVGAIVILGVISSPLSVRLFVPGFAADPEKFAATVKLNRIIFPYLLLVSLAAYSMGILNSLKHFVAPAFAPCLLNISIIVFALYFGEGIAGLASGVLIGGLLQLSIQIPVLYKKGFRLHLFKCFRHPGAEAIGRLMLPRVFSSAVYQLNNFVDSVFGSLAAIVGEGGVAVLYFSYRLILFPLGIFSNALSQVILPALSHQALDDNRDSLRSTLSWGLRATSFVILPASVAFMVLARPIVFTLFGGGRFDSYSANITANALFFYSIGLYAYGATKVLQSCFFALKDTVTPAKTAFAALIINVVLNATLMFPFKVGGIALATSISGIITFTALFLVLKKRLAPLDTREIFVSFLRVLLASVCMGLVCFLVAQKTGSLNKYLQLSLAIAAGLSSYVLFCFLFGVREMRQLWDLVRKRKLQ